MCFLCVISAVIRYFAKGARGADNRPPVQKHFLSISLLQANHPLCCKVVLRQLASVNLPVSAVQTSDFGASQLLVEEIRWSEDVCLRGPRRPYRPAMRAQSEGMRQWSRTGQDLRCKEWQHRNQTLFCRNVPLRHAQTVILSYTGCLL
jgi:hypothetical protein